MQICVVPASIETELRKSIHTLNAFPAKPVFKHHLATKQRWCYTHSAAREQQGPSALQGQANQETRVVPAQAMSSTMRQSHRAQSGRQSQVLITRPTCGTTHGKEMNWVWGLFWESSQEQKETGLEAGLETRLQWGSKVPPGAGTKYKEWA